MTTRKRSTTIGTKENQAANVNTGLIEELLRKHALTEQTVDKIEQTIDNIQTALESVKDTNKRILMLLENDRGTGTNGLVARQRDLEKKVSDLDEFKKNLQAKISVLGLVGGTVAAILMEVFRRFWH